MIRSRKFLSFFVALLSLNMGCFTISTMQRANTVGKGNVQFAAEPTVWGALGKGGSAALPTAAFATRYGVTDHVDIGGRVSPDGIEGMAKFQLTPPGGVILSLAPQIGGIFVGASTSDGTSSGGGVLNASLPLLIGIPLGPHQLILTPKIADSLLVGGASGSGSAAANVLMLGGSIGFAIRVGRIFQLLPEFAVLYPVYGTAGATGESTTSGSLNANGVLYQAGVGFLWGGN